MAAKQQSAEAQDARLPIYNQDNIVPRFSFRPPFCFSSEQRSVLDKAFRPLLTQRNPRSQLVMYSTGAPHPQAAYITALACLQGVVMQVEPQLHVLNSKLVDAQLDHWVSDSPALLVDLPLDLGILEVYRQYDGKIVYWIGPDYTTGQGACCGDEVQFTVFPEARRIDKGAATSNPVVPPMGHHFLPDGVWARTQVYGLSAPFNMVILRYEFKTGAEAAAVQQPPHFGSLREAVYNMAADEISFTMHPSERQVVEAALERYVLSKARVVKSSIVFQFSTGITAYSDGDATDFIYVPKALVAIAAIASTGASKTPGTFISVLNTVKRAMPRLALSDTQQASVLLPATVIGFCLNLKRDISILTKLGQIMAEWGPVHDKALTPISRNWLVRFIERLTGYRLIDRLSLTDMTVALLVPAILLVKNLVLGVKNCCQRVQAISQPEEVVDIAHLFKPDPGYHFLPSKAFRIQPTAPNPPLQDMDKKFKLRLGMRPQKDRALGEIKLSGPLFPQHLPIVPSADKKSEESAILNRVGKSSPDEDLVLCAEAMNWFNSNKKELYGDVRDYCSKNMPKDLLEFMVKFDEFKKEYTLAVQKQLDDAMDDLLRDPSPNIKKYTKYWMFTKVEKLVKFTDGVQEPFKSRTIFTMSKELHGCLGPIMNVIEEALRMYFRSGPFLFGAGLKAETLGVAVSNAVEAKIDAAHSDQTNYDFSQKGESHKRFVARMQYCIGEAFTPLGDAVTVIDKSKAVISAVTRMGDSFRIDDPRNPTGTRVTYTLNTTNSCDDHLFAYCRANRQSLDDYAMAHNLSCDVSCLKHSYSMFSARHTISVADYRMLPKMADGPNVVETDRGLAHEKLKDMMTEESSDPHDVVAEVSKIVYRARRYNPNKVTFADEKEVPDVTPSSKLERPMPSILYIGAFSGDDQFCLGKGDLRVTDTFRRLGFTIKQEICKPDEVKFCSQFIWPVSDHLYLFGLNPLRTLTISVQPNSDLGDEEFCAGIAQSLLTHNFHVPVAREVLKNMRDRTTQALPAKVEKWNVFHTERTYGYCASTDAFAQRNIGMTLDMVQNFEKDLNAAPKLRTLITSPWLPHSVHEYLMSFVGVVAGTFVSGAAGAFLFAVMCVFGMYVEEALKFSFTATLLYMIFEMAVDASRGAFWCAPTRLLHIVISWQIWPSSGHTSSFWIQLAALLTGSTNRYKRTFQESLASHLALNICINVATLFGLGNYYQGPMQTAVVFWAASTFVANYNPTILTVADDPHCHPATPNCDNAWKFSQRWPPENMPVRDLPTFLNVAQLPGIQWLTFTFLITTVLIYFVNTRNMLSGVAAIKGILKKEDQDNPKTTKAKAKLRAALERYKNRVNDNQPFTKDTPNMSRKRVKKAAAVYDAMAGMVGTSHKRAQTPRRKPQTQAASTGSESKEPPDRPRRTRGGDVKTGESPAKQTLRGRREYANNPHAQPDVAWLDNTRNMYDDGRHKVQMRRFANGPSLLRSVSRPLGNAIEPNAANMVGFGRPQVSTNLGPAGPTASPTQVAAVQKSDYAMCLLQPYMAAAEGIDPKFPDATFCPTAGFPAQHGFQTTTISNANDGTSDMTLISAPWACDYQALSYQTSGGAVPGGINTLTNITDPVQTVLISSCQAARLVGMQHLVRNVTPVTNMAGACIQGCCESFKLLPAVSNSNAVTTYAKFRSSGIHFYRVFQNPGDIGAAAWFGKTIAMTDSEVASISINCLDNGWLLTTDLSTPLTYQSEAGLTTVLYCWIKASSAFPQNVDIQVVRLYEVVPITDVALGFRMTVSLGSMELAKLCIMAALQQLPRNAIARQVWRDDGNSPSIAADVTAIYSGVKRVANTISEGLGGAIDWVSSLFTVRHRFVYAARSLAAEQATSPEESRLMLKLAEHAREQMSEEIEKRNLHSMRVFCAKTKRLLRHLGSGGQFEDLKVATKRLELAMQPESPVAAEAFLRYIREVNMLVPQIVRDEPVPCLVSGSSTPQLDARVEASYAASIAAATK